MDGFMLFVAKCYIWMGGVEKKTILKVTYLLNGPYDTYRITFLSVQEDLT